MTAILQAEPAVLQARPAFEGSNIRAWMGFKHFIYLLERAVLQWLLDQGTGVRDLFIHHGLGVEIVDCSVQFPAKLELDEQVSAYVVAGHDNRLTVRLCVVRDGREICALHGKVTVALVRERAAEVHRAAPRPLAALEVADLADAGTVARPDHRRLTPGDTVESTVAGDPAAFLWSWPARYTFCHYSDRVQHSGFVRALEEVVDRFLADRGISVGRLLRERSWVPVVSRARVQMITAAHMEETVHTVFRVTHVLRETLFDARMDCYVRRGPELAHVATARILHGYFPTSGENAGLPVKLDDTVLRALTGARP